MTEAIQLIREEFVQLIESRKHEAYNGMLVVALLDLASAAALKRWNDQRAARIDSVLEGDK